MATTTTTVNDIAAELMIAHPEIYSTVTGLPVWWDPVGPEYRKAQAKWRRFVVTYLQTEGA